MATIEYRFDGGPFEGTRTASMVLGDWVVLYYDERQQPTSAENAFALAAYKQVVEGDNVRYQFQHCLTPGLQKFQIDYADGPFAGSDVSNLPMSWLPAELVRPLARQARAICETQAETETATYQAHYQRRPHGQGFQYYLAKITRATTANDRQAA